MMLSSVKPTFLAVMLSMAVHAWAQTPQTPNDFSTTVAPFFKTHCLACHGPEKSKGDITLHTLDGDLAGGGDLERWSLILDLLESGEMPPEDEKQPSPAEREAVTAWIRASLKQAVARAAQEAPAAAARRLTNLEYENTMRDLLGFRLKLIDNLPKDPVKPYTFNNTAEFMRMGPEQVDRYLECARRAMASAIVDPGGPPEVQKTRREWQQHGIERGMATDEVGIWGNRRHSVAWGMGLKGFPETGTFRVRFEASAILPEDVEQLPLRLIMGYSININSSTERVEPIGTVVLRNTPDEPRLVEFTGRIENIPAKPGRMVNGKRQPPSMNITPQVLYDDGTLNDGNRNIAMARAVIPWMEFEAPIIEPWPPAHHSRILFDSPLRESDPPAYARAVLERFMTRAYRRPALDEEVERFLKIYNLVRPEFDSLEAAMRETLAMVLISPQFLYHTVEPAELPAPFPAQFALASRLSYFLWGSMPDETLLELAAAGTLDQPEEIARQVERLLADERSSDFVRSFTMQWLSLAKSKTVPINRELFPRFLYYVPAGERAGTEEPYRPTIRDYMLDESTAFVAELIRGNLPVGNVVDSDFAMLNQPLAAHYGVQGVRGNELRRVALQPDHRLGGLLTQGSVLIGNGTGSAPHPIYRAVWLREAILGDEVKPPPAEVPALSDSAGESAEEALTIKDLLAKHRRQEGCNDCHVRLDPWGIPFEHYNAIGKYQPLVPREGTRVRGFDAKTHVDLEGYAAYLNTVNTEQVSAEARVPHGPAVEDLAGLKTHLLKRRHDDIAENLLRRLLAYGIGRKLTYHDRFAVEELLEQSAVGGDRVRDMIVAICQSETFRSR